MVVGMIEDYLQEIVENRRDQHYLLDQVGIASLHVQLSDILVGSSY